MATKTMTLDLAHFSLQFDDNAQQKAHDARKLFGRGYDAITGTEAGEDDTERALVREAHEAGYTFYVMRSNWVAVRRDLIERGSYKFGHEMIVDNDRFVGKADDLHITWAQWKMKDVGEITIMAGHYATKGRPGEVAERRVNVEPNKDYARGIGRLAEKFGKGPSLVFYGGDQNIVDQHTDTFFGEDLTTAWDELKKWQNTGHGNIDVIASFDKDKRVKAKYIRALNDQKLFMHTDHFPVEAGFTIDKLV